MILVVFLLLLAVNTATATRCFISAPNVFHVGVPENVSVVVYGQNAPVTVQVYLQDYPHKRKIFSQAQADFTSVNIRVVPLDFNLYPSTKNLTMVVKNPQGVRVEQWKNLKTGTGFISKGFDLAKFAMKGIWTVETFYDGLGVHNTSAVFEVKEYVLPRFSIKIEGPDYILPTTNKLDIFIKSQYTYGKPVFGYGRIRITVVGFNQNPLQISLFSKEVTNSVLTFTIRMQDIENMYGWIWFPDGYRLQIEVMITERSTGITERAIENIQFTTSPYEIKVVNTPKYFKQGMPFRIKVYVTTSNNKPQQQIPMRITAIATINDQDTTIVQGSDNDVATKGRTDDSGYADFVIDVPSDAEKIRIKVETNIPNSAHNGVKDYVVGKYHSKSKEYLMIRQQKPTEVGQIVECEVFISRGKSVTRLVYMVIARGQIVYQNVESPKAIIKTIRFQATPMMSPSSRFVAYYIRTDGEVVADVTTLEIIDSLPNTISIVHSKAIYEKEPAEEYTIRVLGENGTRIGLLAVDQSVYLLRNKNRLTPKSVFKKLDELDLGCGAGGGKDTEDIFKNSGLSVMYGTFVSKPRPDFTCHDAPSKRKKRAIDQGLKVECCRLGNTTDSRGCIRRLIDLEVPAFEYDRKAYLECTRAFIKCCIARNGKKDMGLLARSSSSDVSDLGNAIQHDDILNDINKRSFFPETWLFAEKVISDKADELCKEYLPRLQTDTCRAASLTAQVPDTITTFIVQAIAVSNQSGFGIAKPLNLRIFKDVFMTLKMPYSAQRGEQISILATVYNYRTKRIGVQLFMSANEGFCSMASIGEALTLLNKNELKVDGNGGMASFPITIVPVKYGEVPVLVYYKSYGALKDSNQASEKNDTKNKMTPFQNGQILDIENKTQIDKVFVDVPKDSIPESITAKISFTGNLIGPSVTNLITDGFQDQLRLPTGCGEQTMIKMAPNVYVLKYLSTTKQLTDVIEVKAYNHIKEGYRNELNYRRDDHSYSTFRESPGIIWLTAFVVKVFSEARTFHGIRDHIDQKAICQSVSWIVQHQRDDGAIPEVHPVLMKSMIGGVYQKGNISITAFVITALLECRCDSMISSAKSKAVSYLENNLNNMTDPYTISISTYALALANSPERHKANNKLMDHAIYDAATNTRHWNTGSNALNIETAAYALLAQMTMNRLKYGGPIVTWLTKQRNSGGGFESTTDTCMALQALAKYSEQTTGAKLNLQITIAPKSIAEGAQKPRPLLITKDNALLQQSVDIYPYLRRDGRDFEIKTVGTGVAQMQIDLKYNQEVSTEDKCAFTIEHSIKKIDLPFELSKNNPSLSPPKQKKPKAKGRGKGNRNTNRRRIRNQNRYKKKKSKSKNKNGKNKNSKKKKKRQKNKKKSKRQKTEAPKELVINVCTKYKKPGKTGMAIVDVGVLTGYEVDNTSVSKLKEKMDKTIENYEIYQRSVVFYLNSIDSADKTCLGFKIQRKFKMGAVYPVPIKVYDYYEPDDKCTKYYNLGKRATTLGSCSDDGLACKCTQENCAALRQSLPLNDRWMQSFCNEYDYAITGKVISIDEKHSWLKYDLEVDEILMQGNQKIKPDEIVKFWKRAKCLSPDLKKNNKLLILGRDKAGRYNIDNSALVVNVAGSSDVIADLKSRLDNGACINN